MANVIALQLTQRKFVAIQFYLYGSDFFPIVSYSFHSTATKFLQHRFSSVRLSKHLILENVRTCGLIKINSFAAKAYSHCYSMNLQAGLGRIAIFFEGMFNDITVLAPSIDKYLIHLLDCNRHDYICLPQLITRPNLLYRYVDIKTLDLAYGSWSLIVPLPWYFIRPISICWNSYLAWGNKPGEMH